MTAATPEPNDTALVTASLRLALEFALSTERDLHGSVDLWLTNALAADRDGDPNAVRYWNHLFTTLENASDARARIAHCAEELAALGADPHATINAARATWHSSCTDAARAGDSRAGEPGS